MFTAMTGMEKNPAVKMKAIGARSSPCSPLGISTYTSVPRMTSAKTTSPVIPNPRHAAPRALPRLLPGAVGCWGAWAGYPFGPGPVEYGVVTGSPSFVEGNGTEASAIG